MWPQHSPAWLALACNLAVSHLRGRLMIYPILQPHANPLLRHAIRRTVAAARRRRRFPGCFADRIQFVRWFCEMAWRACLRRVLLLDSVAAVVQSLPPDQQRLLRWLYVDQLTIRQIAVVLKTSPAAAREQGIRAHADLQGQIALWLGLRQDAFPRFPET